MLSERGLVEGWGHLAHEKAHTLNMRWNSAAQGSSSPAEALFPVKLDVGQDDGSLSKQTLVKRRGDMPA